jgi:hypothetical protein
MFIANINPNALDCGMIAAVFVFSFRAGVFIAHLLGVKRGFRDLPAKCQGDFLWRLGLSRPEDRAKWRGAEKFISAGVRYCISWGWAELLRHGDRGENAQR